MTLKMLRGLIQVPSTERKREQKPGWNKNGKRRRLAKGGDSHSDSVDEYGEEEDPYHQRDNLVIANTGTEMRNLKNPLGEGEYIDDLGFKRDKSGKLVRPNGISDKDWKRMQREEELRRMQHMAHNFNYYAMDKENKL